MKETPYAWVVVWATFVCLALIFGVSYSFAAFFESFAVEFSAQRADVSWIFGLSGLVYFVVGTLGGILRDVFTMGARPIAAMNALRFGAPPHGGIAFGIDRLCMLMAGAPNIREVIAFPKNKEGKDPLTGAPSPVPEEQLRELGLMVVRP